MGIKEAIEKIVENKFSSTQARVAKVLSVSGYTCTVETLDTETEITDVRLQAETSNGIYLKPSIESFVIIDAISDNEYVVVMYSALDEVKFLDGSFGGLIKVEDLVSKLNALENKVNDLITFINTHSHPGNGTPPTPPYSGGNLTTTDRSDIENEKVTHGDI